MTSTNFEVQDLRLTYYRYQKSSFFDTDIHLKALDDVGDEFRAFPTTFK